MQSTPLNAISVDVEEYFHPSEVAGSAAAGAWAEMPSRVEETTRVVLDAFAEAGVRGTFFVLGWVARHKPALVRSIHEAGHELGCHSYWHRLVYELTPEEFAQDTRDACAAISDACGVKPLVYRAPSFSITNETPWALGVLAEQGFTHDSSIYPIRHDRYGIPGYPRFAQAVATRAGSILEVPPATAALGGGRIAPVGGGAYLRLLPYRYTAAGLRRINQVEAQPACVYLHPWELDEQQPRLARGWISSVRTYAGLGGMRQKLTRLLREFSFAPLGAAFPVK
jgi:polysaccharide deacetylase family protein (PEP-CTERM system associated)